MQRAAVFGGHEAEGVADRLGAAGAADAMDIILRVHGEIVIDDMRNAVHINAARGDVGGDQHPVIAFLEPVEGLNALILAAIGMQRRGLHPALGQAARDLVGAMLGARKDQHRVERLILQKMQQQGNLERLGHFIDELRNALDGGGAARDLHRDGILLEFARDFFDIRREGRGEQERLPLYGNLADDAADVGQKAHVQHAVAFVQNQGLQVREFHDPLAHVIKQAAGRRHHHIRTGAQGGDLRAFTDAAKNDGGAQRQMARIGAQVFFHLRGEFAGGGEHQDARTRGALCRRL